MLFWISIAVLVAGVTFAITRPLTRSSSTPVSATEADIAVYKDQLREVTADAASGTLAAAEAEAARAEIARRLLREKDAADTSRASKSVGRRAFAMPAYVVTSIAVPLLSLGLYLAFGSPGMPGDPLSERIAQASDTMKPNDLIAKVEQRLREHPNDGQGWDVIAPVYYAIGRYSDAATAYGNATRLLGESQRRLQGFANSRIRAENGIVPDDAKKALQRILVIAPDAKEPRIWLALAKEQDGRLKEAAADYKALLAEAPQDSPLSKVLGARLAAIESGRNPGTNDNTTGASSAADPAAVKAMNPEERQAFIERMVDGLAARLKADGTDAGGWLKLIRAYHVLGRRNDAIKAVSDAKAGLKGDQTGLARVEDLARQLGLGS
jgi:cytochrome c-type biogenesis protein CcmH